MKEKEKEEKSRICEEKKWFESFDGWKHCIENSIKYPCGIIFKKYEWRQILLQSSLKGRGPHNLFENLALKGQPR